MTVGSTQFSLGYYVDQSIRDKIILSSFINLDYCLFGTQTQPGSLPTLLLIPIVGFIYKCPINTPTYNPIQIKNIDHWTGVFIIWAFTQLHIHFKGSCYKKNASYMYLKLVWYPNVTIVYFSAIFLANFLGRYTNTK